MDKAKYYYLYHFGGKHSHLVFKDYIEAFSCNDALDRIKFVKGEGVEVVKIRTSEPYTQDDVDHLERDLKKEVHHD